MFHSLWQFCRQSVQQNFMNTFNPIKCKWFDPEWTIRSSLDRFHLYTWQKSFRQRSSNKLTIARVHFLLEFSPKIWLIEKWYIATVFHDICFVNCDYNPCTYPFWNDKNNIVFPSFTKTSGLHVVQPKMSSTKPLIGWTSHYAYRDQLSINFLWLSIDVLDHDFLFCCSN